MENEFKPLEVMSLKNALERHAEFDAVISIENADRNLVSLSVDDGRPHLTLRFNDIDFDDGTALSVTSEHLVDALTFYMDFSLRGEGHRLLVHCLRGGVDPLRLRCCLLLGSLVKDEKLKPSRKFFEWFRKQP